MSDALSAKSHINDAVSAFLRQLTAERRLSAYTVRNYEHTLTQFELFLAGHLDGDVTLAKLGTLEPLDFRSFLAVRRAEGVSAPTMRLDLSAIRTFFKFLDRQVGITNAALATIRAPKLPPRLPKPVAHADAKKMIEEAKLDNDWTGARDAALFTLLYGAGLRISEALSLQWADAPLGKSLTLTGKGNKQRMVPILPAIREAVTLYTDKLQKDPEASLFLAGWPDETPPLFFSNTGKALSPRMAQKTMATLRPRLGLPDTATPHALRHAFATQLLAKGGDLRAIQELLGHSSLAATQRYTQVDAAALLKVYNKAHPSAQKPNQ